MQTYIVKISGSILNLSTVHLNGIDTSFDVICWNLYQVDTLY